MRPRNIETALIAVVITTVSLAAVWSEHPTNRVLAIQDSEDFPSPLGIAAGQTLFLNVANTGSGDPIPVELMILDGDGTPLDRATKFLRPGRAASLALNRDDIPGRPESRVLTRAVVNSLGGPDTRNLVISLEVVDNETQRTVILHPGISKGFNPQPDPPGIR
jgi:hypothetical protein